MSVANVEILGRRKILFKMNFYDEPTLHYYFLLINIYFVPATLSSTTANR